MMRTLSARARVLAIICLLAILSTGCVYAPPSDDHLQTVPRVNNRDITREPVEKGPFTGF